MKRRLIRISIPIVLMSMTMLASCTKTPALNTGSPEPPPSSASVTEQASPTLSTSPSPSDLHSGVKTDYSGLTPYKPMEEKYTRLKEGAMPSLTPSGQYGKLLPYVGRTLYADDGYNVIRKYGLVTQTGTIVTDPVYSRVYQGSYFNYSTYTGVNVPFYSLSKLSDKISEANPWDSELYAVCALDGRWVTPFDYRSVFYTDKVIMLVRSHEQNDIDVMDYSGKLLYNTKSLDCYSQIQDSSSYNFLSGYGEGIIALGLADSRTVFIDAVSGNETYTDYTLCSPFSGGLAAAMQNGLYGYINKDFSMIIPPQYSWADYFYNSKSVVQYPDNSYAIIDQSGNILIDNPYYIGRWDSHSYGVYDANNKVVYYDSDLQKITSETQEVTPLNNGWFFYSDNNPLISKNSVTVFKGNETHTLRGVTGVSSISGTFAAVYSNVQPAWQEGLVTLDGIVVIPMEDNQSISIVTSVITGKTFAIASIYSSRQTYKVYDTNGEILLSGNGYATFNTQNDMFEINNEVSFAYIDTSGKDVFRISLMQYIPD